jgi:NCS1 family nucleobase:cation symporter-1
MLSNPDLAPVAMEKRTWSWWDIAALWIAMSICIPTYTMASGLIAQGMDWKEAVGTVFLGNLIVLVPMALNAYAGTAYGIPFPVLVRSSFGVYGSNIPALMRALVACGWFGIQSWIGGNALYMLGATVFGYDPAARTMLPGLGISAGQLAAFLLFWGLNVAVIWRGIESIRWMEKLSAPFLLCVSLGLLVWAWHAAHGFGPILSQRSSFHSTSAFLAVFAPSLTAMVGFWATLSLNIPDFSRFARSQRDQVVGQAVGLPGTMALFAFIGVAVTSATTVIFGRAIWDPVELLTRIDRPAAALGGLVIVCLSTLAVNVAANVVSPANDFANLAPRWINFRRGALITAGIGILIQPWRLVQDPSGYIFTWLLGYSALLGPIGGIMIADFFVLKKRRLVVADLYREQGAYTYSKGFSLTALAVLVLSVLPNLPGFLVQIHVLPKNRVPAFFLLVYNYAWFAGFAVAFLLHLLVRQTVHRIRP